MVKAWYSSAYVMLHEQGHTVMIGHYGFAVRSAYGWTFSPFVSYEAQPLRAFRSFKGQSKAYPKGSLCDADIIRYLRAGVIPVEPVKEFG